jgi:hypothetical protein
MSAPNSTDPSLTALRDDLAALKRDVTGLIEHLKVAGCTSLIAAGSAPSSRSASPRGGWRRTT